MSDRPPVSGEPSTEAGRETKRIFGPDVEWAAHPDPMTGEDWDRMARHIIEAEAATPPLDADRLTAIIESRMSRDLAWLQDDGTTVSRLGPEQVAWAIAHLYETGDVVSGLPRLSDSKATPAWISPIGDSMADHIAERRAARLSQQKEQDR